MYYNSLVHYKLIIWEEKCKAMNHTLLNENVWVVIACVCIMIFIVEVEWLGNGN